MSGNLGLTNKEGAPHCLASRFHFATSLAKSLATQFARPLKSVVTSWSCLRAQAWWIIIVVVFAAAGAVVVLFLISIIDTLNHHLLYHDNKDNELNYLEHFDVLIIMYY